MDAAGDTVRFCPGCGASVEGFDSPRFCAACGQGLHRQTGEQGIDSGKQGQAPPPPPRTAPAAETGARESAPNLRTWPGWLALIFGLAASSGMRQNVEKGDEVGPVAFALADLIVLCAISWLVWRYVKRWKFKRNLANATT